MSMMLTLCPSALRVLARVPPIRPEPMMTTFMGETVAPGLAGRRVGLARYPDAAGGILEHVGRGLAEVELAKALPVGHPHDDQVDAALDGFVDDGGAGGARLEDLRGVLNF